jgi:hypothetical protein
MADTKVTDLTPASAALLTHEHYVNEGGADRKVTGQQIHTLNTGRAVTTKSAGYTATIADSLIRADANSAGFTITLPTAASMFVNGLGFMITVKKIDSSANIVTVQANGAETIDGANTATIGFQYQAVSFISNGTSWDVL